MHNLIKQQQQQNKEISLNYVYKHNPNKETNNKLKYTWKTMKI